MVVKKRKPKTKQMQSIPNNPTPTGYCIRTCWPGMQSRQSWPKGNWTECDTFLATTPQCQCRPQTAILYNIELKFKGEKECQDGDGNEKDGSLDGVLAPRHPDAIVPLRAIAQGRRGEWQNSSSIHMDELKLSGRCCFNCYCCYCCCCVAVFYLQPPTSIQGQRMTHVRAAAAPSLRPVWPTCRQQLREDRRSLLQSLDAASPNQALSLDHNLDTSPRLQFLASYGSDLRRLLLAPPCCSWPTKSHFLYNLFCLFFGVAQAIYEATGCGYEERPLDKITGSETQVVTLKSFYRPLITSLSDLRNPDNIHHSHHWSDGSESPRLTAVRNRIWHVNGYWLIHKRSGPERITHTICIFCFGVQQESSFKWEMEIETFQNQKPSSGHVILLGIALIYPRLRVVFMCSRHISFHISFFISKISSWVDGNILWGWTINIMLHTFRKTHTTSLDSRTCWASMRTVTKSKYSE